MATANAKTQPDPATEAAGYLDGLAEDLADAYGRDTHRGRLDQIAAAANGLAALLRELPAEEQREADLESRVLASYRAGQWRAAGGDAAVTHTDHAANVLAAALRAEGEKK